MNVAVEDATSLALAVIASVSMSISGSFLAACTRTVRRGAIMRAALVGRAAVAMRLEERARRAMMMVL